MKFIITIRGMENLNSVRDETATMFIWFDHYTINKSAMMFMNSKEELVGMLMLNGSTFEYVYYKEEK
jgi:hypothetical protein